VLPFAAAVTDDDDQDRAGRPACRWFSLLLLLFSLLFPDATLSPSFGRMVVLPPGGGTCLFVGEVTDAAAGAEREAEAGSTDVEAAATDEEIPPASPSLVSMGPDFSSPTPHVQAAVRDDSMSEGEVDDEFGIVQDGTEGPVVVVVVVVVVVGCGGFCSGPLRRM
jgi:hypothetical protein